MTTLPVALTNKLQSVSSASSITLSAEECKSLVEAIPTRSFVTVTLKYSTFGSVAIQDVALSAVTVQFLREEATSQWSRLAEKDFSIFSNDQHTHEVSNDYLQNAKYPTTFYIQTKQIGFSEFSERQALHYAGVKEILPVEMDDSRFPPPVSIPDGNSLLLHTVKELELKHKLYNPLEKGSTRREFISSVLVLAASIAEVKMACEENINGSLGYGPVDWMAHYQNHRVCITEGKNDNGLHQTLAQLAAAAEGQKRLPLYGVATTYREWIFLRLDPEDGAIRLPTYTIDDLFDLRKGVQRAAGRLAGILQDQKNVADKATGRKNPKKPRSNKTKNDDQYLPKARPGPQKGTKRDTEKTRSDWFHCIDGWVNSSTKISVAAWLRSDASGLLFSGTKSERVSFTKWKKEYEAGTLQPDQNVKRQRKPNCCPIVS